MMFSNDELDALRELINIGVGRAAGSLNDMIGRTVRLNVPIVSLVDPDDVGNLINASDEQSLACVRLPFEGDLSGAANLLFSSESGSKLVALLTGEEDEESALDSLRAATLTEVGNILLNGLMGSITNVVRQHLSYGIPIYAEASTKTIVNDLRSIPDAAILLARAQFFVGDSDCEIDHDRIDGEITLLLGVDSLAYLIQRLRRLGEETLV